MRSKRVEIKLSEKEYEEVCKKAAALNLKVGTYIRQMAVDGQILKYDFKELDSIKKLFHSVGYNVNQIARHCNREHKVEQEQITQLQSEFRIMSDAFEKYLCDIVPRTV